MKVQHFIFVHKVDCTPAARLLMFRDSVAQADAFLIDEEPFRVLAMARKWHICCVCICVPQSPCAKGLGPSHAILLRKVESLADSIRKAIGHQGCVHLEDHIDMWFIFFLLSSLRAPHSGMPPPHSDVLASHRLKATTSLYRHFLPLHGLS